MSELTLRFGEARLHVEGDADLVIYDAPRELSEFTGLRTEENGFELRTLERPQQSWCYVEAMDNGWIH